MKEVVIVDAVRTPIGRYNGALKDVRPDDLGAVVIKALVERNPNVPAKEIEEVIFGNANQAGEDNRNVARMSGLLAELPIEVGGTTINRLCGSGLDAVIAAARAIAVGEGDIYIAGGTESMSVHHSLWPSLKERFQEAIWNCKIQQLAGALRTKSWKRCTVLKQCRKQLKTLLSAIMSQEKIKINCIRKPTTCKKSNGK